MMAELAPPWDKFGNPSGQGTVLAYYFTNFCSWNRKGPRKCNGINLTYELSELVLQNTN